MNKIQSGRSGRAFLSISSIFSIIIIIVFALSLNSMVVVQASTPLSRVGYLDFSYGTVPALEPTAEKPESKLWWNDGFWWGSMFSPQAGAYHIFRLDWGTQDWVDTGTALDDRVNSRADVLWDANVEKLYVASHVFSLLGSRVNQSVNYGRVYRYSYLEATQTYVLDPGFPVNVNQDKTEIMVLDKDSKGRLWVSYVTRDPNVTPADAQVYFNRTTSTSNDAAWGTPISLVTIFPDLPGTPSPAHVSTDDIVSVIEFGNKIGIMWSNQINNNFYFAIHDDNQGATAGWTLETIDSSLYSFNVNDHIHLTTNSSGDIFASIKTTPMLTTGSLTGLLTREAATGAYSFHPLSGTSSNDTRPIVVVDSSQNKVFVFNTSRPVGGVICYQSAAIVHPLSGMSFVQDNCRTSAPTGIGSGVRLFIGDDQYSYINNSTSTKQNVNSTTGLVVLASDDLDGQVYVHNVMGNPPPVVTNRLPEMNATNVAFSTLVQVTFSKEMKASTLTNSSFIVSNAGGAVTGVIAYDNTTRTASFQPTAPLKAETLYTVTLTNAVKDNTDQVLFGAPETWTFSTTLPTVQFLQEFPTQLENGGNAVITVTLSQPSSQTVTVQYATSDGTATAPGDYTATSGTLTYNPGEVSKSFQVHINDNPVQDGNRTVNLTLTNPTHAILGVPAAAVLTIQDDDTHSVAFSSGSYSVDEGAGSATITVNLTAPLSGTATVHYATSDGTAVSPADYIPTSGTLTFNPGDTTATFLVPIVDDALFEANETIHLTLSNPTGVLLGTPKDAVLTITDNDPLPEVSFSSATYNVVENAGTATITVELSVPSGVVSQVNYQTADETAIAGIDYTATSGTLTFAAGEITKTFSVPILDDLLNEPAKTVGLLLSEPSNATLGLPSDATLMINDNDPLPTVQFSQALYTGLEASGTVTITVTLNTPSGEAVSIDYASSNGTAHAGTDYTAVNDTLVFLAGETSKTFDIHLTADSVPEPKEWFTLTLMNPDKVNLGTPGTSKVVIDDGSKAIFLPLIRK